MALDKEEDRNQQAFRHKNPNPFKSVYAPITIELKNSEEKP